MRLINKEFPVIVLITFAIGISGLYIFQTFQKSEEEIIEANSAITESSVSQLAFEVQKEVVPIWRERLYGKDAITKAMERSVDTLLSAVVNNILMKYSRVEGGIYFFELDEFIGYGFPTIEPPIPAFGPPPRSYDIIRDQVVETIHQDTFITKLHEFDPAIFPLSTKPITYNGETIGAVWTRKHIERELASIQNISSPTFLLSLGLTLFGLSIVIFFAYSLKKHIKEIRTGLGRMKKNPSFRLTEKKGMFGFITRYINNLMDAQEKEQEKRKRLERELYQTEKMATLGNLVAGAAHEINTPISIIKTRLQIWERKLIKEGHDVPAEKILTSESVQIVHSEIDRVSKLIKRLLLLSKPVSRLKRPTNIHNLIEEKLQWVKKAYPDRKIETTFEKAKEIPLVEVDPQSIDQVFMNIFKNAVEATEETCFIKISTRHFHNESEVEIRIRDYGNGIPKSVVSQIFDPFFTTKDHGTGLGLSISYEIIKAHGGTLYFEVPTPDEETSECNREIGTDQVEKPISKNLNAGKYLAYSQGLSETTTLTSNKGNPGTICIIRLPINNEISL